MIESIGLRVILLGAVGVVAFVGVILWQMAKLWLSARNDDHGSPAEQRQDEVEDTFRDQG